MKKLLTLIPLLIVPLLSGCDPKTEITQLTYGTYLHNEAVQLSSSEFTTHFESNENFLLAIYPKDSSCSCWRTFESVLTDAVMNENLLIYKYYAQDVDDNNIMKEVGTFNNRTDAPTFYIIKNKKIARYYNYSNNSGFFKKSEEFINELALYTKKPKMYYVETTILDSMIEEQETFNVFFSRSGCSDCQYVIPNTLVPYFESLENPSEPLFIYDLEVLRGTPIYQETKDHFQLSEVNNPNLGFEEGVVPTFQHYENGELKDMCVYFNEGGLTLSVEDDCYYALGAYYNETRLAYMHYLDNVAIKDLTKLKIDKSHVSVHYGRFDWDTSDKSVYYDTILKAFLDTYL